MTDYEKYLGGLRKKYGTAGKAAPGGRKTEVCRDGGVGCGSCCENNGGDCGQSGKIAGESYSEEEIERLINEMAIAAGLEG